MNKTKRDSMYISRNITYHGAIIRYLQKINNDNSWNNILIVTKKSLVKKLGVLERIKKCFSTRKIYVFDKVMPNPKIEMIEQGIKFAKENNIKLVVGLGGGSVIDTAKTIALFVNNPGNLLGYFLGRLIIKNKAIVKIAIPTTAGSGSEATRYVVINYFRDGKIFKKPLEHKFLMPDFVILDAALLLSLNRYRTATIGLDVLSHAIESYWSIHSNKKSDEYAQESIKIVINYLEKSCNHLNNLKYREKMLLASNLAGRAINITKTTIVHAVSYPITNYFNIPHGLACGLILPSFLKFNAEITRGTCNDKRGVKFVKSKITNIYKFLGVNDINHACQKLNSLMENIGLKLRLRENGIDNLKLIIDQGFMPERAKNNPRNVNRKDLKNILKDIY
ncbi:hypothetical protein B6D52_03605 [Candidatus Parcubacteria bacterium 4484_255]|nr:MAG: hypothetical protein B6D52_03605 [Candidatus Parcubacteria bacterium 4484_255]